MSSTRAPCASTRCCRNRASSATTSRSSTAPACNRRLPAPWADVAGGTWSALDGDCNPLRLLRALHAAIASSGGVTLSDCAVDRIEPSAAGFVLRTSRGVISCERVVLAAGLGNARLAPMVGLAAPVTPNKGQIMVTRARAAISRRAARHDPPDRRRHGADRRRAAGRGLRRLRSTPACWQRWRRAPRACFPRLRDARVVRAWAALRVMSPDGFPDVRAVERSARRVRSSPATAASRSPPRMRGSSRRPSAPMPLPPECAAFDADRFDVRAAA